MEYISNHIKNFLRLLIIFIDWIGILLIFCNILRRIIFAVILDTHLLIKQYLGMNLFLFYFDWANLQQILVIDLIDWSSIDYCGIAMIVLIEITLVHHLLGL